MSRAAVRGLGRILGAALSGASERELLRVTMRAAGEALGFRDALEPSRSAAGRASSSPAAPRVPRAASGRVRAAVERSRMAPEGEAVTGEVLTVEETRRAVGRARR